MKRRLSVILVAVAASHAAADVRISMPAPPERLTYRPASEWNLDSPEPDPGVLAIRSYSHPLSPARSGWYQRPGAWGWRGGEPYVSSLAFYGGVPYHFAWPNGAHFRYPVHRPHPGYPRWR